MSWSLLDWLDCYQMTSSLLTWFIWLLSDFLISALLIDLNVIRCLDICLLNRLDCYQITWSLFDWLDCYQMTWSLFDLTAIRWLDLCLIDLTAIRWLDLYLIDLTAIRCLDLCLIDLTAIRWLYPYLPDWLDRYQIPWSLLSWLTWLLSQFHTSLCTRTFLYFNIIKFCTALHDDVEVKRIIFMSAAFNMTTFWHFNLYMKPIFKVVITTLLNIFLAAQNITFSLCMIGLFNDNFRKTYKTIMLLFRLFL